MLFWLGLHRFVLGTGNVFSKPNISIMLAERLISIVLLFRSLRTDGINSKVSWFFSSISAPSLGWFIPKKYDKRSFCPELCRIKCLQLHGCLYKCICKWKAQSNLYQKRFARIMFCELLTMFRTNDINNKIIHDACNKTQIRAYKNVDDTLEKLLLNWYDNEITKLSAECSLNLLFW